MTELSKIVQQRLKAKTAPTATHPDADLLTAFAERSLMQREHAGVMEHLARCGECREVVALALPEVEELVPVKGGVRGSWFRLPAFRWAAIAVAMAVAVSVGTVEYRNQSMRSAKLEALQKADEKVEMAASLKQPSAFANVQAESGLSSAAKEKVLAKDLPAAALAPSAKSRPAAPNHPLPSGAFAGSFSGVVGFGGGAGGGRKFAGANTSVASQAVAPAFSAQGATPSPARPATPPVSESVEVASNSPTVEADQVDTGFDKVGKAKPSANLPAAGVSTQDRKIADQQILSLSKVAPRWTIAANGALQRSFDGGANWQNVDVTGDGAMQMQMNYLAKAETAEAVGSPENQRAEKKGLKKQIAGPVFRAIAATGSEVWAGGTGGVLYHTIDAGNSWARVVPSYQGVVLGGDIVRIEFPDVQHGQVATSNGEIWTTSDSGQHWLKVK